MYKIVMKLKYLKYHLRNWSKQGCSLLLVMFLRLGSNWLKHMMLCNSSLCPLTCSKENLIFKPNTFLAFIRRGYAKK